MSAVVLIHTLVAIAKPITAMSTPVFIAFFIMDILWWLRR